MMKTFIGSICAVCVIPLKDEGKDVGADVYRSHVPIQIEAHTIEWAEAEALKYCHELFPESNGYLDHTAQVKELEITVTLCAQVTEFALSMADAHMKEGRAALSRSMPLAMPPQINFAEAARMAAMSSGAAAAAISSMLSGPGMSAGIGKMLREFGYITPPHRPQNVSDVENLSSDHKE